MFWQEVRFLKNVIRLCTVFMLISALTLSAFAEKAVGPEIIYSYAERLYEGEFDGLDLPKDASFYSADGAESEKTEENAGNKETDSASEAEKRITSDDGKISFVTHEEEKYVRAQIADGKKAVSVKFSLEDMKCISGTDCLGFAFHVNGEGVTGAVSPYANVTVRINTENREYVSNIPVPVHGGGRIYSDVSGIDCDSISSVTVELALTDGVTGVTELSLTEPYVSDSYDFTFQRKQGFEYLSVINGNMEVDKISLSLWDDDEASMFLIGTDENADTAGSRRIRYLSVGSENECVVSARDADSGNKTPSAVSISADSASAVFRLNGCSGVSVSVTGEGKVIFDELKIYDTSESAESNLHALSLLSITDGELTAKGTLDRQSVKKYTGCRIGLFRLPAAETSEPELVAQTRVTSRFSFKVSGVSATAYDYMYYAAIIDKNDEYIRISPSQFVSATGTKSDVRNLYGLYGVDPVAVYEAGASYTMVDVDLAKLTSPDKVSGITAARGGYVFGLNSEYVEELDSYMELYRTAGISVYIKLYCSEPIKSKYDDTYLTYRKSSSEYMLRSDTPEAAGMYTAVVSYLCRRYPGIASFVISSGVNSVELTGMTYTDTYKSAENIAMAARLIYGAASEISDIFITVPVCDIRDRYDASPEVLLSLVAEKLMHVGHIPWAVMYTGSECELPEISDSIISLQRMNNTSAASFTVYCYAPEKFDSTDAENYRELCKSAESTPTRTVFLSEALLEENLGRDILNGLNRDMKGESSHLFTSDALVKDDVDTSYVNGINSVWDFSSVHSTLGWVGGYGIEKLSSAPESLYGDNFDKRVLRCVTADRSDSAGVLMCRLEVPVNLASAPLVEFVYSYECDTDVNVVFVFANGENRAEFKVPTSVSAGEDGKYTAVCDLSEFSKISAVAYIGVLIYSDSAATFDISQVSVMSTELDRDEVSLLFEKKDIPEEVKLPVMRIIAVTLLALVTVIVTSVCIIRAAHKDKNLVNVIKKRRVR